MEELPLFGRRFSATTKDEKTRAALGIFAHYDKLLLYRSNTHTLLVSKNNTKKSPLVEQLSTSPQERETLAVQREP